MKTIIIFGGQGTGKTTLAVSRFEQEPDKGKELIYSPVRELSGECGLDEIYAFMAKKTDNLKHEKHSLLIDETDVVFSLADPDQKKLWKNYWATARHAGLQIAIFCARRYVEFPTFLRASATEAYASVFIRDYTDLKTIEQSGGLFRKLPASQMRKGEFQDVIYNASLPPLHENGGTANLDEDAEIAVKVFSGDKL